MFASDYVAIALVVVTLLNAFLAFIETLYPPETGRGKRSWRTLIGILVGAAVILSIVQIRLTANARNRSEKKQNALNDYQQKLNKPLKLKIDLCAVVVHAFRNERYLTEERA